MRYKEVVAPKYKSTFMDKLFNRRLRNHLCNQELIIVAGDRGSGKSTMIAFMMEVLKQKGIDKVYSQFPYDGAYQIPLIPVHIPVKKIRSPTVRAAFPDGKTTYELDKEFLYASDLTNCAIFIDEAAAVWHARSYTKWLLEDEELMQYLRKQKATLVALTQNYDLIDLNIKRAANELWYLTKGWFHFTRVEITETKTAKIAKADTEIVGKWVKKGMRQVTMEICEQPIMNTRFWRKPFYGLFDTYYMLSEKKHIPVPEWGELYDFVNNQQKEVPV